MQTSKNQGKLLMAAGVQYEFNEYSGSTHKSLYTHLQSDKH